MAININFNSGNENNNKNDGNKNKRNCIDSNDGNSNGNNNNNNSSRKNNMNSSNINSKINTKNINNNSKENNINSNGGDNSTNKQKQASDEDSSSSNSNNNSSSKENNINSSKINSIIIGDSMVKKIDEFLLTSSINYRYIVKVRPFLSTKTIDMVDYMKPTQRDFNPDVYLLHVGTNDLSSKKSPGQISLDILNLADSLKLENNNIIVSSIVPRDDQNKKKVDEVNIILELYKANNVDRISHSSINPKRHINRSRLHLNDAGVSPFLRNFRDFLNNFDKI